jgi:hypothetical protein
MNLPVPPVSLDSENLHLADMHPDFSTDNAADDQGVCGIGVSPSENLTDIMARLCAKHDLTFIDLKYSRKWGWSAAVFWNITSSGDMCCAQSQCTRSHGLSAAGAVNSAICECYQKRQAPVDASALDTATLA